MTENLRLAAGEHAPDFTLPDQDGTPVTLSGIDGPVVLWFYPAALTPACTTQACDLRDRHAQLTAAGYTILGVSKDSPETLKRFQQKEGIDYPLLSDEDLTVHRAYGAYGEKNSYGRIVTGTLRSTFVIDADGTLTQALYNVKASGHIDMLRRRLGLPV